MTRSVASHAFASPVGVIVITADDEAITGIRIAPDGAPSDRPPATALLAEAERQLLSYFKSDSKTFDLPLATAKTPRGEELRAAIAAIQFGETASYGELARRFASSPRAIGQACKRNPFPIVIPCHRVIGSGGTIGHYSGGAGVATKARLLNHEAEAGEAAWPE